MAHSYGNLENITPNEILMITFDLGSHLTVTGNFNSNMVLKVEFKKLKWLIDL
jgi:hypothetical protein